ncbi:aspartyl-phosphate phosphatase Spo0E family protein [Metabacillus fastidiosus]|uniref:aspartyl-phosphate phosphatase Spo0E family protein n=1 Tax=Metabacillus fastidiosus TaxID=1458 RepID=UPI002DB8A52F|nr:aspartyl-phosphate phosphatase Spo0E family protein [Metabacillus fastidiosus]MEC2074540.1 aspartyl-phosphate phosphatase Spo0E family protein [Metabacillus fastidiosus]MED4533146.1 aspartyl-phosphate phosphatase Spo0E family protein [Metabacillus fastidiosus]
MNNKPFFELAYKINLIRQLMIVTGQTKGLNHPETLKYSQELDRLIFTTQKTYKSCS